MEFYFNHHIKEILWTMALSKFEINIDNIIKNNKQTILTLYQYDMTINITEIILKYHLLELCKKYFNENKEYYQLNYKIINNKKRITFKYCFDIFLT